MSASRADGGVLELVLTRRGGEPASGCVISPLSSKFLEGENWVYNFSLKDYFTLETGWLILGDIWLGLRVHFFLLRLSSDVSEPLRIWHLSALRVFPLLSVH